MPGNTTTTCPPTPELERLVRGRLTEARSGALCEHIGACPACQKRIEAIAGNCDELACTLRECTKDVPPTDSAYHRALAEAEAEVRATTVLLNGSDDSHPAGELKLDFLQPSDEPGRLGRL